MQLIKPGINISFMRFTRIAGLVSVGLVLASMVLAVVPGPNYGIDFTGGTEIQFMMSESRDIGEVRSSIQKAGYSTKNLVRVGGSGDRYRIRLDAVTTLDEEKFAKVRTRFEKTFSDAVLDEARLSPGGDKLTLVFEQSVDVARIEKEAREAGLELRELSTEGAPADEQDEQIDEEGEEQQRQRCTEAVCPFGKPEDHTYDVFLKGMADSFMASLEQQMPDTEFTVEEIEWVGPAVGRQLRDAGIKSLLYAMGLILIYVAFRFDLRFAPGAVACLLHDVLITIGIFVIMRREVSLPIIAALLTIVGYSLNDTIVVFDRIRENLTKIRERDLKLVVNKSINETLSRTILTSMTTLLAVLPIIVMARGTIQNFAIALVIGIFVGTYSSVYIASPIAVWLDEKFFKKKRMRGKRARAGK